MLGTSALCSRPGLQTKQPAAMQQEELNNMLSEKTETHRLGEGLGCLPAARRRGASQAPTGAGALIRAS